MITVRYTGLQTAKQFFRRVQKNLVTRVLYERLGPQLRNDVRRRISTGDYGRWDKASKWTQAKKATTKALKGQEKNIHHKHNGSRLTVYGVTDGSWSFNQHHTGFTNKLFSSKDVMLNGRVYLLLLQPSALPWVDSNASVLSFKPKRAGSTPARAIWPSQRKAEQMVKKEASRWVFRAISKAGGTVVK
tara:strand:- start:540 stop:1103 length:564 start_codon:yes stop_codon:yes gene_type:complete